jgi:pentatricopeptide repeat protein
MFYTRGATTSKFDFACAAAVAVLQALKLLDVMWPCGGELVPDIVSYNTVMKACGNAQETDRAFEVRDRPWPNIVVTP